MKFIKPHFNDFSEDKPGPYYDPNDGHIHNWKNSSLIKNFTGEQFQNVKEYFIDNKKIIKNGEYCCICHKRKSGIVTIPIINDTQNNVCKYIPPVIKNSNSEYDNTIISKKNFSKSDDPIIIYLLNNHESLYIKKSEMTYYQKFRYMNPDYKKTTLFIINNDRFSNNYYIITN